jgi:hypothetical protein
MKEALLLPAELVRQLLQLIRKTFFADLTEKQWYQERPMIEQAICYPARWLKEKGATKVSAARYRSIIQTVITAIKKHANRQKIERFSVYFLHCVQEHIVHHGETYYNEAKAPRTSADLVARAMSKLQPGRSQAHVDRTVEVLAETHRVLARRGRIQKPKSASDQPDLFSSCTAGAPGVQKAGSSLRRLRNRSDSAGFPQKASQSEPAS